MRNRYILPYTLQISHFQISFLVISGFSSALISFFDLRFACLRWFWWWWRGIATKISYSSAQSLFQFSSSHLSGCRWKVCGWSRDATALPSPYIAHWSALTSVYRTNSSPVPRSPGRAARVLLCGVFRWGRRGCRFSGHTMDVCCQLVTNAL